MIDPTVLLSAGLLATFIPLILGLLGPWILNWFLGATVQKTITLFAAVASGLLFWFFLDVMGDAALLDVNAGFNLDYTHYILAAAFAISLLALFWAEHLFQSAPSSESGLQSTQMIAGLTFGVAILVALGIGFHAVGEGIEIGDTVNVASSVLDAIGGVGPGIAYVLHKLLEGFVIGTFAILSVPLSAKKIGLLALITGIPTMIGFFLGMSNIVESTYFFALSGGAALYAEFKLIPKIASSDSKLTAILGVLLGFYLMYLAGLFHG